MTVKKQQDCNIHWTFTSALPGSGETRRVTLAFWLLSKTTDITFSVAKLDQVATSNIYTKM